MNITHSEPSDIVFLRNETDLAIEIHFAKLKNNVRELFRSRHVAGFLAAAEERLPAFYSEKFITDVINKAYRASHRTGIVEIRNSAYNDEKLLEMIAVENSAIGELVKAAGKKVAGLFTGFGKIVTDAVKKVYDRVVPKKKQESSEPLSPREIELLTEAAEKAIDKYKQKVKTTVQDEITKAEAEAKLDAYQAANIKEVIAQIETVKDHRRCKKCEELEGKRMTIEQARSLLPRHPNCRCLWRLVRGGGKKTQSEQKEQEFKVKKLRQRLDRRYKLKLGSLTPVHNSVCGCEVCVWNQLDAELQPEQLVPDSLPPDIAKPFNGYVSLPVWNAEIGSYHVLLQPVPASLKRAKSRISIPPYFGCEWGASRSGNSVRLLPGTVVRLDYHNPRTEEMRFVAVANMVADKHRADWEKEFCSTSSVTIPLSPEELGDYPYRLATNGVISAILLNERRGYFDVDGVQTPSIDFERLLEKSIKLDLTFC